MVFKTMHKLLLALTVSRVVSNPLEHMDTGRLEWIDEGSVGVYHPPEDLGVRPYKVGVAKENFHVYRDSDGKDESYIRLSPAKKEILGRPVDDLTDAHLKEFREHPMFQTLPYLSRHLGETHGITGMSHAATAAFHTIAGQIAHDDDEESHYSKASAESTRRRLFMSFARLSERPWGGKVCPFVNADTSECRSGRTGRQMGCPEGDRCHGLCGKACDCWKWSCGHCCYDTRCAIHDAACKSMTSAKCATATLAFECKLPIAFSPALGIISPSSGVQSILNSVPITKPGIISPTSVIEKGKKKANKYFGGIFGALPDGNSVVDVGSGSSDIGSVGSAGSAISAGSDANGSGSDSGQWRAYDTFEAQLQICLSELEYAELNMQECACQYVGVGTDLSVQYMCQAFTGGEIVCYNQQGGWCAQSEHICMIPSGP